MFVYAIVGHISANQIATLTNMVYSELNSDNSVVDVQNSLLITMLSPVIQPTKLNSTGIDISTTTLGIITLPLTQIAIVGRFV